MKARAEYTDTFGGEANYSWVNRCEVEANTERGIVQKVKAEFGLTGVRCKRNELGDEIWLYPQGEATVVFIYFDFDYEEEKQMERVDFIDSPETSPA